MLSDYLVPASVEIALGDALLAIKQKRLAKMSSSDAAKLCGFLDGEPPDDQILAFLKMNHP